jgi:hypothetical protein
VCEYHSRRKVFIVPIIAILLLCLLSSSLPFSTHSRIVSAADSVFYDFITEAPSASWSSGAGSLPFPSSDSDSRGFALYRDNWQLEDNSTWARALETHPQWVSNGWIMGVYPQMTVPSDAELKVTVGFFKGATVSDGVTFEVKFEEFLGLTVAPKIYSILSHGATYDGKLDSIVEDLSSLEGKTGNFVLYANAGQSSGQDWAAWAEAKIEAPSELPDLIVSKIECGPGNKLSVTIKNIGSGALPDGWEAVAETYFDDEEKGFFNLTSPISTTSGGIEQPGGSSTYLLAWDITAPVTARVIADSTNDITESNEQNNSKEEEVIPPVVKLPDLLVTEIEYNQQADSVSCIIKNAGEAEASSSFVVLLSISDPFVHEESEVEATLEAGETATLDFELSVQPAGQTVTIQVCADTLNQIPESNEQNNCLEKTFAVEAPPTTPSLSITSGPSVSGITTNSATITWTTNLESDSHVSYDTCAGKFGTNQTDAQFSLEHQIILEGLTSGTAYQFIVESKDETGDTVQSRLLTFVTLPAKDKEKPSLSMTLPSKLSGKREVIEIAARDNTAVERVNFYVDGKLVFTDYSSPFCWECDTTLFDEGIHSFGAMAYDAAGNAAEIARDGEIQNLFPINESPVKVNIVNPTSGSDVYGIVEIRATVTHDKEGQITHTEVKIDGSVVHEVNYMPIELPPLQSRRIKESKYSLVVSYLWDTSGLAPGQHVIEVSARDEFGNEGHQGIRVTKVSEPSISIPFSIIRTVTPNGNYFRVELTVSNLGTGSQQRGTDVIIRDISRGFQAAAFERTPTYDWLRSEVAVEKLIADFSAGGSITFSYDIVPVLFDPMLDDYTIGTRTIIEYNDTYGHRITQEYNSPYIPGDYVSYPYPLLPEEIGNAFNTVDYLIITDPERLFRYSDAAEVNQLLSTMAELALQKNGVLGYRRPGADWFTAGRLKDNFTPGGIWGSRLSLESALNGYILLVGETDIIPAWRLPCPGFFEDYTGGYIDISDYPYADVVGDERPELRVGRIIGENAGELIEPIRTSLGVHIGRADYDGSDVLFVTGPEGTWEASIKNAEGGRVTVAEKGVTVPVPVVHTEYYTTQHNMLAEALRIKGPEAGGAAFDPDPPMHTFSVRQLAAWLLDSEGELSLPPESSGFRRATFTDTEGREHCDIGSVRISDGTFWGYDNEDEYIQDALRIAEGIQADREGRDGDYGWTYVYLRTDDEALNRVAEEVKAQTPNKDVIVFLGHGGPGSWGCVLDDWTTSECPIESIDFGRSCPIVVAFSCLTGNYEDEPGMSIARAFLRNGAAVYIGSTEVSSSGAAEESTRETFWRSWTRSSRIGDAFFDFRDRKMCEGGGWRYFVYEYNLYGDPKFGGDS